MTNPTMMLFVTGPMGDDVPFDLCQEDFTDGGTRIRFTHPTRYKLTVNDIDVYRQWKNALAKYLLIPAFQTIIPNILMLAIIVSGLANGFCLTTRSTWFTGFVCFVWIASMTFLWSRRISMTQYAFWTQATGPGLTNWKADNVYKWAEQIGDRELLGVIVQRAVLSAELRKKYVYSHVDCIFALTNRNITLEEMQHLYMTASSEKERGWIANVLESRGGLWAILEED